MESREIFTLLNCWRGIKTDGNLFKTFNMASTAKRERERKWKINKTSGKEQTLKYIVCMYDSMGSTPPGNNKYNYNDSHNKTSEKNQS